MRQVIRNVVSAQPKVEMCAMVGGSIVRTVPGSRIPSAGPCGCDMPSHRHSAAGSSHVHCGLVVIAPTRRRPDVGTYAGNLTLSRHEVVSRGHRLPRERRRHGCDAVAVLEEEKLQLAVVEKNRGFTLDLPLQAVDRSRLAEEAWRAGNLSRRPRCFLRFARFTFLCRDQAECGGTPYICRDGRLWGRAAGEDEVDFAIPPCRWSEALEED